jgi:hypothetical protein
MDEARLAGGLQIPRGGPSSLGERLPPSQVNQEPRLPSVLRGVQPKFDPKTPIVRALGPLFPPHVLCRAPYQSRSYMSQKVYSLMLVLLSKHRSKKGGGGCPSVKNAKIMAVSSLCVFVLPYVVSAPLLPPRASSNLTLPPPSSCLPVDLTSFPRTWFPRSCPKW